MQANPRAVSPAALNTGVFLALAAGLLALILARTRGHFTYCLDDPYIHLALAERIRHGLYGLNQGEPASPSSSILWPLLFVLFAGTPLLQWLPLLLNLACGAASAWLLGICVEEAYGRPTDAPLPASSLPTRAHLFALALLLVFALNLWGLAFTGLEHSLQVLLCVVCALAAGRVLRGERLPWWSVTAAILLPSVRYEGVLIAAALALVLAGTRAWRSAVALLLASMAVPAAFSVFLHRLGLPWFPLSVLVKSSYKFADQSSLPKRVGRLLFEAVKQSLTDMERLPQLVIMLLLAALAWRYRRTRTLRFTLAAAAMVGAVQVVLGPVGWFYRYEIYALAFTVPVLIAAAALPPAAGVTASGLETHSFDRRPMSSSFPDRRSPRQLIPSPLLLPGVALLALVYLRPLAGIPRAALGIYEQQYQMGRLMGEFYHAPVAVNDLGWVAFRRTPQQYTLDLYGLGSYEAFRTKEKDRTPAWLDAITRDHHVGLVAIYPEWFRQGVPESWAAVAKLCAADVDTSLGPVSRRVMLYQTPEADGKALHSAIAQWRDTLPAHVTAQLDPPDSGDTCE